MQLDPTWLNIKCQSCAWSCNVKKESVQQPLDYFTILQGTTGRRQRVFSHKEVLNTEKFTFQLCDRSRLKGRDFFVKKFLQLLPANVVFMHYKQRKSGIIVVTR